MKWGGRGRARGGGGLVVVQKYMGSMVYRGGGPEAYTTPYTTLHKHATCTGGGVGPAGHRPSSLQLYTKVQKLNSYCFEIFLDYIFGKLKSCTDML